MCELPIEVQQNLTQEYCEVIDNLLKVRDEYYLKGGKYEALLYLKRYWDTCFNKIPFPEKYLKGI